MGFADATTDNSTGAALKLRLEQQRHWSLAPAVKKGQQPPVDPDSHALRELRGNDRVYESEGVQFVKQLVDGAWSRVELYYY